MPSAVVLLLVAIVTSATGCSPSEAKPDPAKSEPTVISVQTVAAERVSAPNVLRLDGTLQPYREAKLSPLVAGHVSAIEVERGDTVKKGDALVKLRADSLRFAASSAAARAKAQREQLALDESGKLDLDAVPDVVAAKSDRDVAADELKRMTPLFESGAIDERTYERAKAALDSAEAHLKSAKQRAEAGYATYRSLTADAAQRRDDATNSTLVAPFDGAVMKRLVEVGEFVGPQQPVIELVDTSKLRLELDIPERSSGNVKIGQTVEIEVDGTGQKLTGEIAFVAAAIEPDKRTLTVEVVIDNAAGEVRAGHFARARLTLEGSRELLRVPRAAVTERAGVYRIYVVEAGHARARIVELVDKTDDHALLGSDLASGVPVVSPLPNGIGDGVAVTTTDASPDPAAANEG
ncbi:MAG: efflux RND transporter periplasmic adaptor subunit [Polyangiaceae bacterium]